jgi:DNA-3-methyladenine glycosylase I
MQRTRCPWGVSHELYRLYHDLEWGVPVHEDRLLFEMLNLEGVQAGLNWLLVLQKREHYRLLFDNFDAEKIARYTDERLERLLKDPRIIRNRKKVFGIRSNAVAFLKVREEFGTFDRYIWHFVGGEPVTNHWRSVDELPASTSESTAMSRDLRKRGFTFVGPTICYSFMQAVGMVNDHLVACFRHGELAAVNE